MNSKPSEKKKLFVLDTNVLMHDPASIFRFQEHHIFIPMIVLEELDRSKKGASEVARNARQASRFFDELVASSSAEPVRIEAGIPITNLSNHAVPNSGNSGRLFFQTRRMAALLPESLPGDMPDHSILATVLSLIKEQPEVQVILVSKDINLRIKATILGIQAEDYYNDQVLDDIDLLYTGMTTVSQDFWELHAGCMESWQEQGRTFYKVEGSDVQNWFPNESIHIPDESQFEGIVRSVEGSSAIFELSRDYRSRQNSVWGIQARNREQNFAFNVLLDPDIDIVTIVGTAGTGKTLLSLAAGLTQTMENKIYREIIMTRETIPVGEDIGFLPGTEEEKMTPWMGALLDNLELLGDSQDASDWERGATSNLLRNRIKIRSLNFMRGRTFLNRFIILDEAQNLTPKQIKTLITRAGPGTKIVCIGNVGQIDTPYLTGTTCGLTYAVDRFKTWQHSAHITLKRGERSRLSDYAVSVL
ncbi:MAG: PhoH family protein [Methylococcaceae bacterium]|nr:PhoH family protein [Methylococcaceae bacterium]